MTTTMDSCSDRWGANLRAARMAAGLTQVQLAQLVGLNQYTICKIENGDHRPKDQSRLDFARIFGLRVEDLFPYPHPVEGWAS